jgi:8-amino-7-oxononanoate synthase
MKFPEGLSRKLSLREQEGMFRVLQTHEGLIDFFSNDYLGFASDPNLDPESAGEGISPFQWNGSTGSRLISGNSRAHEELEMALAKFFKAESALMFNSGYDANIGLLSAVLQRQDAVFFDRLSHASIRDGISLSSASSYGFEHNDLDDLKKKISKARSGTGQNYVIVESVYSMDGDEAPLEQLAEYCRSENLYLIVDEAHSTGVMGQDGSGMITLLGFENEVFARIHTFGKALGCHGAAVLGSEFLKKYLINFARSFIYTTALPPREVLRISAALKKLKHSEERDRLSLNIDAFLSEIENLNLTSYFIPSRSPIQSFLLPDSSDPQEIRKVFQEHKMGAKIIFSPTVPKGQERIRICIHSFNTSSEIQRILQLLSTFV